MFHGSIVALVTPFRNGRLDETAFQDLVAWHLGEGTQGFVPVGTTGESPTLSHPEHERVVEAQVGPPKTIPINTVIPASNRLWQKCMATLVFREHPGLSSA